MALRILSCAFCQIHFQQEGQTLRASAHIGSVAVSSAAPVACLARTSVCTTHPGSTSIEMIDVAVTTPSRSHEHHSGHR
jgi:hypothetical protein